MREKKIAILLAFLIALGSLSGCGSQTESGTYTMESTNGDLVAQNSEDQNDTYYEIFVYSYADSDGDGIGDLQGIIDKLDYLNDGDASTTDDLGVTALWLMPIMPSPTYHKYDVIDYYDIDSQYGDLTDFQNLLEEAHNRDMKVIIDMAINHTSSEHPWFTTACEYLQNLNGAEPDVAECPEYGFYNFSTVKEGSAWYEVEGTDYYYEAQFWSGMPDLNLDSDAVREELTSIFTYWLDLGVDGFRLDAVTSYYTGHDEENIAFMSWLNDMVKAEKEDAYIVAEAWTNLSTYGSYYASGIDSFFDFQFADKSGVIASVAKGSKSAMSYVNNLLQLQEVLEEYGETAVDAPFYTNHDMARSAGYYAGDYKVNMTKLAGALNLMMSGNAFVYYGEELGMKGSGIDENKRAPMQWSSDADADYMCDGPADMEEIEMVNGSLEEQEEDADSIYQYYREAIRIREAFLPITNGTVEAVENLSGETYAGFKKVYNGEEVLILFSNTSETQEIDLSEVEVNGKTGADIEVAAVLTTTDEPITFYENIISLTGYSVVILQ